MSEVKTISVSDAREAFRCAIRQFENAIGAMDDLAEDHMIELTDDNPIVIDLVARIGPIPIPGCPPIPIVEDGFCDPVVGDRCGISKSS